ncbi:MAG TPA: hypothetical protein PKD13_09660, partial [Mariniflexile sp.]|nr:hypothetical protein [Mariniflexile sp.]
MSVSWKLDCKKYILIMNENRRNVKIKALSNLKRLGKILFRMAVGLVLLGFYEHFTNLLGFLVKTCKFSVKI